MGEVGVGGREDVGVGAGFPIFRRERMGREELM
jgi:hypothetical protein